MEVEEIESCKEIAYRIGLEPSKVDAFMEEVRANPKIMVDLETLEASFRS